MKGLFTSAWVSLSVSLRVGVRASASVVVSVAVSVAARVCVRDRVKSWHHLSPPASLTRQPPAPSPCGLRGLVAFLPSTKIPTRLNASPLYHGVRVGTYRQFNHVLGFLGWLPGLRGHDHRTKEHLRSSNENIRVVVPTHDGEGQIVGRRFLLARSLGRHAFGTDRNCQQDT